MSPAVSVSTRPSCMSSTTASISTTTRLRCVRHIVREYAGNCRSTMRCRSSCIVGSGFERKGVRALIDAATLMRETRRRLWIIGKDKHSARYAAYARAKGIAERIRFFGPQQDVRPFYGAADAFALPTLYDPFPNAALEALASGLPVRHLEFLRRIRADRGGPQRLCLRCPRHCGPRPIAGRAVRTRRGGRHGGRRPAPPRCPCRARPWHAQLGRPLPLRSALA